jgi:hypothetical protein
MRRIFVLAALLLPLPAAADPRCAHFGQPAYSATRSISTGQGAPVVTRITLAGPQLRIEAPGPGGTRLVTLVTPDIHAIFVQGAEPAMAMRLPRPAPPAIAAEDRRLREERTPAGIALITELRGASGHWHEVERNLCRRDGVLLEARLWKPGEGGGTHIHTRQTEIRLTRADPALFRLPAGARLIEPPPVAAINRRTAPPPG